MNQKTVCESGMCTGCMACVDLCPKSAIKILDRIESYDAVIDSTNCVECGACHKLCRQKNDAVLSKPISWKQGWAYGKQREKSSSGGVASAIAKSFIRSGGIVCACTGCSEDYCFKMYTDEESLNETAGSKYVKSNPSGSYTKVRDVLKNGKRVLFIGLPCQVASLRAFVGEKNEAYLYTIDLICHGTPSPQILSKFLANQIINATDDQNLSVRFRDNGSYAFGISINGRRIRQKGSVDAYTSAFLKGYSYTRACYSCKYAGLERSGDLTLGDSWGTDLPKEAQEKGISLCLCQNGKGIELLKMADLQLHDVNLERAVESNAQLMAPFCMPKNRARFFKEIEHGHSVNYSLFVCMPVYSLKQYVKNKLLQWSIISI